VDLFHRSANPVHCPGNRPCVVRLIGHCPSSQAYALRCSLACPGSRGYTARSTAHCPGTGPYAVRLIHPRPACTTPNRKATTPSASEFIRESIAKRGVVHFAVKRSYQFGRREHDSTAKSYLNHKEHKGHKEIQEKHPCLSVFIRGWKTFLQAIQSTPTCGGDSTATGTWACLFLVPNWSDTEPPNEPRPKRLKTESLCSGQDDGRKAERR
jgi:hypothetical protein